MSPSRMTASSGSYRCRSDPQILVVVTRTIASVGSWIFGSGTSSTRTSRLPCHVNAFMCLAASRLGGSLSPYPRRRRLSPRRPVQPDPGEGHVVVVALRDQAAEQLVA